MSFRTFRISQMTCMACGHPQRCKLQVANGIEFEPLCDSCGRTDSWMSLPTLREPAAVETSRERGTIAEFMARIVESIGKPYISDIPDSMGRITLNDEEISYQATDEFTATAFIDLESLIEFFRTQGIELGTIELDDED